MLSTPFRDELRLNIEEITIPARDLAKQVAHSLQLGRQLILSYLRDGGKRDDGDSGDGARCCL